jgi:hypothetical protein
VIDTATDRVISEVSVGAFDPTPVAIRNGRGFLYDARLSGNGTVSCASCHIDGNHDRLAWDLGDPGGQMQAVSAIVSGVRVPGQFNMHPMKGPMTTQSLKGLRNLAPLHWRGDRGDFTAFKGAFDSLLGGSQLPAAEMNAFRDFVETMQFPPNPNQQLDRTLPVTVAGGDPNAGRNTFVNENYTQTLRCNTCHTAPLGPGTDRTITPAAALQESQSFKVPQLRNMYEKTGFDDTAGAASLDGFGFTHDGVDSTLFRFLSRPVFVNFRNDPVRKTNLNAFLMCFDTGVAPAVGFTRTLRAANASDPAVLNQWSVLQTQATIGNIDLIVKGTIDGKRRGLLYQPTSGNYTADRSGVGPFTRSELEAKITAGDTLSIIGVPPGSGVRMGIDRDLNGKLDGDGPPFATYAEWRNYWFTPAEAANTSISGPAADLDRDGVANLLEYALNGDPKNAQSTGAPALDFATGLLGLIYTRNSLATDLDYVIEESLDLKTWSEATPANALLSDEDGVQTIRASVPAGAAGAKFLRLRVEEH